MPDELKTDEMLSDLYYRYEREVWKAIAYLMELEKDETIPLVFRRRLTLAIQELSQGSSTLGDLHNDILRLRTGRIDPWPSIPSSRSRT
jgi:hypothetical protein